MLAHCIPAEAELQADLDAGAALGVELLSTLEVICGEASLAAGLVAWPGGTWHGWWTRLSGTDLDSDLAGRHTCGLKAQDLLLFSLR